MKVCRNSKKTQGILYGKTMEFFCYVKTMEFNCKTMKFYTL